MLYIWAFGIMYDLAYRGDTFFLFTFKCNGAILTEAMSKTVGIKIGMEEH